MNFKHDTNRIYLEDESGRLLAEITFPIGKDGISEITRTFVDPSLRGQGVAGLLMEEAVKALSADGRQGRCLCSYASTWLLKHPETGNTLIQS